jgi:hypothetical protein
MVQSVGPNSLIKSVLSTLPIYLCSALMALVDVMQVIGKDIKRFMWHGGKANSEKYHLVNWNTIQAPYDRGGFSIRDPTLTNLVLGAKIFWWYI